MSNNKSRLGVIYKIFCKSPEISDFYVGSTCNLDLRKFTHKSAFINNKKNKLYEFMRKTGNYENWDFEIIDKMNFVDRRDLLLLENEHIIKLNPSLNMKRAVGFNKSYYNYKRNEKEFICECGSVIKERERCRHYRTKKHQQYIKDFEIVEPTI